MAPSAFYVLVSLVPFLVLGDVDRGPNSKELNSTSFAGVLTNPAASPPHMSLTSSFSSTSYAQTWINSTSKSYCTSSRDAPARPSMITSSTSFPSMGDSSTLQSGAMTISSVTLASAASSFSCSGTLNPSAIYVTETITISEFITVMENLTTPPPVFITPLPLCNRTSSSSDSKSFSFAEISRISSPTVTPFLSTFVEDTITISTVLITKVCCLAVKVYVSNTKSTRKHRF